MLYLILVIVIGTIMYLVLRSHAPTMSTSTRIIGPDDDPEFLQSLNHPKNH